MSAGRKTGSSNVKDLDENFKSTPSGKRRGSNNKRQGGGRRTQSGRMTQYDEDSSIDLINVVEDEFESVVGNGKEKNRYTVTNDNYINAQVNFANCELCIIVSICIICLQMLNQIVV